MLDANACKPGGIGCPHAPVPIPWGRRTAQFLWCRSPTVSDCASTLAEVSKTCFRHCSRCLFGANNRSRAITSSFKNASFNEANQLGHSSNWLRLLVGSTTCPDKSGFLEWLVSSIVSAKITFYDINLIAHPGVPSRQCTNSITTCSESQNNKLVPHH